MVKLGDTIRFKPAAWTTMGAKMVWAGEYIPGKTEGKVVYINHRHGWYRVRYEAHGIVFYECFKIIPTAADSAPQPNTRRMPVHYNTKN